MPHDPYLEYLARFEEHVGALAVGSYGKYQGRLVKKLNPAEFLNKFSEYEKLASHYRGMIERGDTLNDALLKVVRERQAELLIEGDDLPML